MFIHPYSCVASIYEYTKYVCFCKMEIRYIFDYMHSVRKHLCWKLSVCICVCVYNCIYIYCIVDYVNIHILYWEWVHSLRQSRTNVAFDHDKFHQIASRNHPQNQKNVTSSTHSANKNIAPAMGSLVVPRFKLLPFFSGVVSAPAVLEQPRFLPCQEASVDRSWWFFSKGRPIGSTKKQKKRIIESSNWCLFGGGC